MQSNEDGTCFVQKQINLTLFSAVVRKRFYDYSSMSLEM